MSIRDNQALTGAFVVPQLQISAAQIALGSDSTATGAAATAVGFDSTASGDYSICVGPGFATGINSVSVGASSNASGLNSIAIGRTAAGSGAASIAIGRDTVASANNSVAIGNFANTNAQPNCCVINASGSAFTTLPANGGLFATPLSGYAQSVGINVPGKLPDSGATPAIQAGWRSLVYNVVTNEIAYIS